jgi:hypothetical protein
LLDDPGHECFVLLDRIFKIAINRRNNNEIRFLDVVDNHLRGYRIHPVDQGSFFGYTGQLNFKKRSLADTHSIGINAGEDLTGTLYAS